MIESFLFKWFSQASSATTYKENRHIWAHLVAQMVKESAYNAGDLGSVPGLGRFPREGNGNPLHYCCLKNSKTEAPVRL